MWVSVNNSRILYPDWTENSRGSSDSNPGLQEHLDRWCIFPITVFAVYEHIEAI